MLTNCVSSNPVFWDIPSQSLKPLTDGFIAGRNWNFLNMSCDSATSTIDNSLILIKNDITGAEFYLNKTLSYGDALIIWFLTIFTIVSIFRLAYNFFWKK